MNIVNVRYKFDAKQCNFMLLNGVGSNDFITKIRKKHGIYRVFFIRCMLYYNGYFKGISVIIGKVYH